MPRTGISYKDVEFAIDSLLKNEEKLTVQAIRAQLGTGSNSTINKFFQEWKKNKFFQKNKKQKKIEKNSNQPQDMFISQIEFNNNISRLEQENIELREKLFLSECEINKLNKYKDLYENLLLERESISRTISQAKKEEIEFLFKEVKEINIQHSKQLLEMGSNLDEKLLKKEIEIVDLKNKLKNIEKTEVKDLDYKEKYDKLKNLNTKLIEENTRLVNKIYKKNKELC